LARRAQKVSVIPRDFADVQALVAKNGPCGLSLTTDKHVYVAGESIEVSLISKRDCFVQVFDISRDETISLLFPSPGESTSALRGGMPFVLNLQAAPPFGFDLLVGIGSPEVLDRSDISLLKRQDNSSVSIRDLATKGVDLSTVDVRLALISVAPKDH
jgi:hypothetical protein